MSTRCIDILLPLDVGSKLFDGATLPPPLLLVEFVEGFLTGEFIGEVGVETFNGDGVTVTGDDGTLSAVVGVDAETGLLLPPHPPPTMISSELSSKSKNVLF